MADFHFHVTQLKRSEGKSAIAAAAYRACEKLHSDYYNETNDYSNKGGLVYKEIALPDYVPEKYSDRETLWNEVEATETRRDAQLAYNFDFSLQNEFSMEENIEIAKRFIYENFVSRGMICDFTIHNPEKDGIPNPHVHLLCPIRPMTENGEWGAKQKRVPVFDENGEPVIGKNGKQKYNAVKTTDWSDAETLIEWRESWAEINNKKFEEKELPQRISADSYETQGLNLIPTIHEGPAVREMEKRGIVTEKGEFNRWVRKTNALLKSLKKKLDDFMRWIEKFKEPKQPDVVDLLTEYLNKRNEGAYSQKAKKNNLDRYVASLNFLRKYSINSVEKLDEVFLQTKAEYDAVNDKIKPIKAEISELNKRINDLHTFEKLKPIHDGYKKIPFKKYREEYYQQNKKDLDKYFALEKKLAKYISDPDAKAVAKKQIDVLTKQVNSLYEELEPVKEKMDSLNDIKYCVDEITGKTDSETKQTDEKEKIQSEPQKKESILGKLSKAKAQVDQNKNNSRTVKHTGQEL